MRNSYSKRHTIIPLYLPWLFSVIVQWNPILSYWIAWLGSFFIFYWTLFSPARFISSDLSVQAQIMRPIFLIQIIFAGFMCSTSVFYFLDHLGYHYLEHISERSYWNNVELGMVAECQRLCLLGHAALVSGIVFAIPHRHIQRKYQLSPRVNFDSFLIVLSIAFYAAGFVIEKIPAISQFSIGLMNTGIIAGAFVMVKGFIESNLKQIVVGGTIFIINFINATLSGYKEHILVNFLIIGCLVYPFYRRSTLIIGIPVLYALFYILPTYVNVIRSQAWSGEVSAEEARTEALQTLVNANDETIDETNWGFLTGRLSEIGMFVQFVESTPTSIPFYGTEILENSIYALVPRFLWSGKPNTEAVAMERVYVAGVADRRSIVSAKTRPVVDGYLSWGAMGVFVSLLIYGLVAQVIDNKAESLFGGYQLGCMIIFNGLFQALWRGNNFEFIINTVFYSFVLMLIVFGVMKEMGILVRVSDEEEYSNQVFL